MKAADLTYRAFPRPHGRHALNLSLLCPVDSFGSLAIGHEPMTRHDPNNPGGPGAILNFSPVTHLDNQVYGS